MTYIGALDFGSGLFLAKVFSYVLFTKNVCRCVFFCVEIAICVREGGGIVWKVWLMRER